jgi:hypothetical protein
MTYAEYVREGLPWPNAVFAAADPNEPVFAAGVEEAAIRVWAARPPLASDIRAPTQAKGGSRHLSRV